MSTIEHCSIANDPAALGERLIETLRGLSFFDTMWEKDRLHLTSAFSVEELATIFPLQKFDEVLTSGSLMSPHLDIVRAGKKIAAPFRTSPSPATDVSQLLHELKNGSTVRVAHIEHYIPSLSAFCRSLEAVLHLPIRANLYMTPPFSQGFAPHFDLDDIFVMQVLGKKQWYWHSTYANQAELPNQDMPFEIATHRPAGQPTGIMLSCGDLLYLPRGFMHEARTNEEASIHITFAVIGMKLGQFVEQLVKKLAIVEPGLRRTVSFDPTVAPEPAQLLALASEIRMHLDRLTESEMLTSAVSFMRHAMAQHRNPGLQGALLRGLNDGF